MTLFSGEYRQNTIIFDLIIGLINLRTLKNLKQNEKKGISINMNHIAIFASGEGTNAQNIIDFFKDSDSAKVSIIVSNNPKANVLNRAQTAGISTFITNRTSFYETDTLPDILRNARIDFIVLAGFLWKIPSGLIQAFPNKIINIHPALLPKFGGKGMYGMRVHEAVIAAQEKESGITIHYVNENYDEGQIIAQYRCAVEPADTAETVANKIHQLEKEYFPKTIHQLITEKHS